MLNRWRDRTHHTFATVFSHKDGDVGFAPPTRIPASTRRGMCPVGVAPRMLHQAPGLAMSSHDLSRCALCCLDQTWAKTDLPWLHCYVAGRQETCGRLYRSLPIVQGAACGSFGWIPSAPPNTTLSDPEMQKIAFGKSRQHRDPLKNSARFSQHCSEFDVQRTQNSRHCSNFHVKWLEQRYAETWLPLLPVANAAGGFGIEKSAV